MIPALVQWEITDRCPYSCPHCYHEGLKDTTPPLVHLELSEEEVWRIAKIIVHNHLFFVPFTGGEPLVRKKLLADIASFLRQNGIVVSLNTSLAVFDRKTLSELTIDRMLISCPASEPTLYRQCTGNGDYCQFEKRLCWLIEAGQNLTVNMVVTK